MARDFKSLLWADLDDNGEEISTDTVRLFSILFACNAVVRGLDYITGSSSRVADLITVSGLVNQLVNLEWWGWIFLIFGVELIAALVFRKHFFVFLGHGILLAAYAMLMVSTVQVVIHVQDDWRAIGVPVGGMAWHFWRVMKVRPWPRRIGQVHDDGEDREEYL